MRKHAWVRGLAVVSVVGLFAAACGDDGGDSDSGGGGGTPEGAIVVPDDHDTIQAAVDAASEGDLVYVREGTYNESVIISTPNIVLRGADRNKTVIDAGFSEDEPNCLMIPETNGVAVENLTVTNCTGNGVYFTGVDGYRASYVNAIRAGVYGIYAFDSVNGRFEHSYAAGSADAGYYIGQCDPCNAVLDNVISEWNGLGYSGTNSGGELYIINSTWRENRSGIVPNSLTSQQYHPQREVVIAGNHVYDNNNPDSPAEDIAEIAIGTGILIAGGTNNLVTHNLVENNETANIAVVPLPESILRPDSEDGIDFEGTGNRVIDNTVGGESMWDIGAVPSIADATNGGGNCFSGNNPTTSGPENLEELLPCDGEPSPDFEAPVGVLAEALLADQPDGVPAQDAKLPSYEGEQMPDADSAPPVPATPENLDLDVDVDAISTPPSSEDDE